MGSKRKGGHGEGIRIRDTMPNRMKGDIALGANAATAVFEQIKTNMTAAMRGVQWYLLGVALCPKLTSDWVGSTAATGERLHLQLAAGQQAAMLAHDDDKVLVDGYLTCQVHTNGAPQYRFPWMFTPTPLGGIPFFGTDVTLGLEASNSANWNSTDWSYDLWYQFIPLGGEEGLIESLQATGQLA